MKSRDFTPLLIQGCKVIWHKHCDECWVAAKNENQFSQISDYIWKEFGIEMCIYANGTTADIVELIFNKIYEKI